MKKMRWGIFSFWATASNTQSWMQRMSLWKEIIFVI